MYEVLFGFLHNYFITENKKRTLFNYFVFLCFFFFFLILLLFFAFGSSLSSFTLFRILTEPFLTTSASECLLRAASQSVSLPLIAYSMNSSGRAFFSGSDISLCFSLLPGAKISFFLFDCCVFFLSSHHLSCFSILLLPLSPQDVSGMLIFFELFY